MSIKVRLLLSYLAMLITPVILSLIAGIIVMALLMGNTGGTFIKPGTEILQEGAQIFDEIKVIADNTPDQLRDDTYLKGLDNSLYPINTGLVVRDSEEITYVSNFFNREEVIISLLNYRVHDHESGKPKIIDGKLYLISQHEFFFQNGNMGTVFLLTDMGPMGNLAHRFMVVMTPIIILILFITNFTLIFLVSRSIIRPLDSLKKATEQIKDGNLDFEISYNRDDEIGELSDAFEEMRKRLKHSLEQQIQYEDKRKELISSISHDLKTPITSIKGHIEGIIDGVADSPEKMEKYVQTIYAKANDLDHLIDELFLFSKLDTKNMAFQFESIDIVKYLADCTEEMQLDMENKNILLTLNSTDDCPIFVRADRDKLKRVIMNILGNAQKYQSKENGRIELILTKQEETITVEIRDNGRGISEDNLAFIFESFYRGEPSRNLATGGSGLGLAIAKGIIEEHGGEIWAESIENEGTSIFFSLKRLADGECS